MFPEASIINIHRTHFDHCLMLLNTEGMNSNFTPNIFNTPFHFLTIWMEHPNFMNFVGENWNNNLSFHDNFTNFTCKVKNWNGDVYGNIFYNKERLKARLTRIQISQKIDFSHNIGIVEKNLKKEFQAILRQDELLW